jgi:hypothetical protein
MAEKENPAPDLFQTFERVEKCFRVEVTEANLAAIARHFGWDVTYRTDPPRLLKSEGGLVGSAEVGSWIDHTGARWNPEPLTQGWHPEGTFPVPNDEATR